MVRKGGLEPPRYCYRQPLKLVRLPIPPLSLRRCVATRFAIRVSRFELYFFTGAGVGAAGAGACVVPPVTPRINEPGPR